MIKTTIKWKNVNSFEKNWDLSQKHDFHVPINKLNHVLLQVGLIWQSLAPGKPNTKNRSNETKIAARWVEPLCAARKTQKNNIRWISNDHQNHCFEQQKTHLMLEKNLMLDRLEISSFEMRNFCLISHNFKKNAAKFDDFLKRTNNTQENNTLCLTNCNNKSETCDSYKKVFFFFDWHRLMMNT